MIPVRPFLQPFYCERCRSREEHLVTFLSYNPETQMVSFLAECSECEEEEVYGFTASLPIHVWNKITPVEDEIILN